MDTNYFCEEKNCISEASAFYFKASKQRKVCNAHLPIYGEKLYPIEQFYFLQSPEDETELLRRRDEVRQGKVALEKVLSLADDEKTAALALLDKKKARAVQVLSEVYEAEKRRTKQHFHQIEVFIKDFTQELELYLYKKENCLSSSLGKLATELSALSFLRVKTMDNDLELAQVVTNSCSSGELSFDQHLSALLNPKLKIQVANHLFMLAKKSSQTDSYIELQQALANCSESEALSRLPEVTQLKTFLEVRLESMKAKRETELRDLVTRDPESVRSLLDFYLSKISSIQTTAGEVDQVERLYEKVLSFALPESQSKVTLDILLSYAKWCTEQGQGKTRELKKVWKAALTILIAYYPNSQETMKTTLQLGKLYQQEGKYTTALEHCQAAVAIGKAEFAESKETAEALTSLGAICYLTKDVTDAEGHYIAALYILNANFQQSSERATVYASLGMLYRATERFAEAESHYQSSVDILRSYFSSSHQLAWTLTQFGSFYSSRGSTSEAEKCLKEAYEISSSNNFQDLLEHILAEGYKTLTVGDVQKLIAVLGNEVKCFNVATSQWQQLLELRQNIQVDQFTSSIFIPPNRILVCGGGYGKACTCHVDNSAYILEEDGSVQELPHMSTGRYGHGVAWDSDRQALYVFGGWNGGTGYTGSLRTSEKFLSKWLPLPDMHQARRLFNSCWHSSIVYLCGGCTNSVEVYDPRSNTFVLQDFTLPESGYVIAVVENETLTVISNNYISKLQQGRLTSQKHQGYLPWSSCTPLVSGRVVYVYFDRTCSCIDLTTGTVQKKVSLS